MISRIRPVIALICALALLSGVGLVHARTQQPCISRNAGAGDAQISEILGSISRLSLQLNELSTRLAGIEPQAQPLIDIELITRAELRVEDLRTELLDLQIREMDLQSRLEDLDYRLRPQNIQRALALVGSVRMDELREDLRTRLDNERSRVIRQLDLVASIRERLEATIKDAEAVIDGLRQRLRSP